MLYFPKSRYQLSQEMSVATGQSVTAEGQCMVASTVAGVFGVEPSAGSSGELFMGFAVSEQIGLNSFTSIEALTISSGLTYTTTYTPSSGTVFIFDNTDNVALVVTTDYTISGSVISFTGSTAIAGKSVTVFYRYAPTTVQANSIQGNIKPGGPAAAVWNQVGVIKSGVIYTSEWDTSVNWLATNPALKTGANGRVTIGGSGVAINGVVVAAPNSGGPDGNFLGIEFSAM